MNFLWVGVGGCGWLWTSYGSVWVGVFRLGSVWVGAQNDKTAVSFAYILEYVLLFLDDKMDQEYE